jgi:WD40 repeat protein
VKPGQIKVWNVDNGQETATLSTEHFGLLGPVFNRDGDRLAARAEGVRAVRVWAGVGGPELYTSAVTPAQ